MSALLLCSQLQQPFYADFAVFWKAGQIALSEPSRVYDTAYLTEHIGLNVGPRPFAYPPTALLAFIPLGQLPFPFAYGMWVAVSVAAFVLAVRRLFPVSALVLCLLAPPVVLAAYTGQTSLLLASAALIGIRYPWVLGVAAAMKPQLFVLAPLVLDREALSRFLFGGVATCLASLVFGFSLWLQWANAVPAFMNVVADAGYNGISLLRTAWRLGVPELGRAFQLFGILAGVGLALWARRRDEETRTFAMIAGGLLCSPYAMHYEMAGLAPFAAAALFSRFSGAVQGLPMLIYGAPFTFPAAVLAAWFSRRRDGDAEI
jgi:hypothetical protein